MPIKSALQVLMLILPIQQRKEKDMEAAVRAAFQYQRCL